MKRKFNLQMVFEVEAEEEIRLTGPEIYRQVQEEVQNIPNVNVESFRLYEIPVFENYQSYTQNNFPLRVLSK